MRTIVFVACCGVLGLMGAGVLAAAAPDPASKTNNLLVVCYDPVMPNHGGVTLSRHFQWNDPGVLTAKLIRHLYESSRGYLTLKVAGFTNLNAFPVKRDGFRYTEETYLEMWKDRSKAHQPDGFGYAAMFKELNLVERVRKENITEIWVWGAPYFGTDEYAMKIPGDQLFHQTDNPWFYRPYDIPDCGRTVWVMGFNYEVGEDNALHSFGHRCEGILSMTVGRGVWSDRAGDTNAWSRFTRQADKFPKDAQVGNVHGGPNAKGGYDYGQTNIVMSAADNWLNYPDLSGPPKPVSADTWGAPHHLNFQRWWLGHLPRNAGQTEGCHNNWWRYIADYDAAVKELPPPGGMLQRPRKAMY